MHLIRPLITAMFFAAVTAHATPADHAKTTSELNKIYVLSSRDTFVGVSAIARPRAGVYIIDDQTTVKPWLAQVSQANICATTSTLSAFHTRYYTTVKGKNAALWIRDSWQALANDRSDAQVELFTACSHCSTQPSVILTVQGVDPGGMVFEAGRDPEHLGDGNDFPYIHTVDDILGNMNDWAEHSVKFAHFGLAFIAELAKTKASGEAILKHGFGSGW